MPFERIRLQEYLQYLIFFSARVNVVGAPTPTPWTAEACTVSFTVMALSPTPISTPTPTLTPTPTPKSSEPNNCGGTCGSNSNCQGGLFCYDTGSTKILPQPIKSHQCDLCWNSSHTNANCHTTAYSHANTNCA